VTCPCGSEKLYDDCCGPFLARTAQPQTAEALMRSRYTAYTRGDVDYVLETLAPEQQGDVDRESTEQWSKQSEWLGLEILSTEAGQASDTQGVVEFLARYKVRGTAVAHRERATFRKQGERWLFVDGEQIAGPPVVREAPRIGRNDTCPCGSGKKYKKCCGKAAA
jgi:SEC-C motif-containing protein